MLNRRKSINHRALLLAILAISVCLRMAVAVYLGDQVPPGKDETSYSVLASRLQAGFGYSFPEDWYPFAPADTPTAHWSFLYTAFIAAVYAIVGVHPIVVRLIGAVIGGLLLPGMVYRLVSRILPRREWLPLIAAACAALYAYFVLYAAMLMTETFFIITILWSLERAILIEQELKNGQRPNLINLLGLGVSLGIATLLRQSILPWVGVLFIWLVWMGFRHKQLKQTIRSLIFSGTVLIMFIIPFTIRNYRAYDDFLLLNSNAGYAMFSAQHPMHGTNFQAFEAAPLPRDISPIPRNEAQWDRVLMQRGIQSIFDDPGRYLLLSASRTADYFMFWPSGESSLLFNLGRVLSFGIFLPLMIVGLWLSRKDWQRYRLLYLFIIFYTVLHLLTWSMIRYRLPVDAVLLLFASLGLFELASRLNVNKLLKWQMKPGTTH